MIFEHFILYPSPETTLGPLFLTENFWKMYHTHANTKYVVIKFLLFSNMYYCHPVESKDSKENWIKVW